VRSCPGLAAALMHWLTVRLVRRTKAKNLFFRFSNKTPSHYQLYESEDWRTDRPNTEKLFLARSNKNKLKEVHADIVTLELRAPTGTRNSLQGRGRLLNEELLRAKPHRRVDIRQHGQVGLDRSRKLLRRVIGDESRLCDVIHMMAHSHSKHTHAYVRDQAKNRARPSTYNTQWCEMPLTSFL
jgi:hypothetical protein